MVEISPRARALRRRPSASHSIRASIVRRHAHIAAGCSADRARDARDIREGRQRLGVFPKTGCLYQNRVLRQKLGVFVGARDRRRNLGRCARFQTMLTRIAARDFKRRDAAMLTRILFFSPRRVTTRAWGWVVGPRTESDPPKVASSPRTEGGSSEKRRIRELIVWSSPRGARRRVIARTRPTDSSGGAKFLISNAHRRDE